MIYFFSDAHLGSRVIQNPQEHQQKVIDLLTRMAEDATAIYLLGDIFDFWYEYFLPDKSKCQYQPLFSCLKQLTQRGIEVHFFIGNHDIWTFGWLARQTGVIVHREPLDVLLNGKRCLLAHGDGLIPQQYLQTLPTEIQRKIRHFIWLRKFFHSSFPQFLFRLVLPCVGNAFGYEWARRSRLKELLHPCPYKGENQEELVLFAKEQERIINVGKTEIEGQNACPAQRDYYIFGHRHIELDLQLQTGARVLILGDMFKQWTYAQMDEQGNLWLNNLQ